jgi:hypothetical protein
MPYRRPGWMLPNGHIVRSNMEAALCEYLSRIGQPHLHRTLSFETPIGANRFVLYVPSLLLTERRKEGREIVIEPIDSVRPGGGLRRLQGFRRRYGDRYFVVVVARRALHAHISPYAYNEIFPLEDFSLLEQFLRQL